MTNKTQATRWGTCRQGHAERTRHTLRVKQSARKGSRALGRASASLSDWNGEGPTLSDAEVKRRPLPARWQTSRPVFVDRPGRADHVPGIRKLLVTSKEMRSLVAGCGTTTRAT